MEIKPAKPYFPEEDLPLILSDIKKVLRDGMLTNWKKTEEFENKFADYVGSDFAVGVNSATAGLHLAMRVIDLREGDEVIVPTNTMAATANCVLYERGVPIFADMDMDTFCVDVDDIEKKITKKTKAVIIMHHSGNMCDVYELCDMLEDYPNIKLIEDCAHSLGSTYNKKHSGTFGDIGVFSFYPTKLMTTGEGGMVVCSEEEIADKMKVLRDQGKKGFFSYKIIDLGYNYRMPELSAILGIHQLKHMEEWVKKRNTIAKRYTKALPGFLKPQLVKPHIRHSYYKYQVMCGQHDDRKSIRDNLKEKGISTSLQYDPLVHQQPYLIAVEPNCRTAELFAPKIFSLPLYNQMTKKEVDYVCHCLKRL